VRLVFIHGINNEGNSAETIANDWWQAITDGWKDAGLATKPKPQIDAAFYGDILAAQLEAIAQAMGDGATPATTVAFAFLQAYQDHLGLTPAQLEEIRRNLDPNYDWQEQGLVKAALVKLASAIASVLPNHGKTLAGVFLKQAVTYIDRKGVRDNIHNTVRKQVFKDRTDPVVVVSHSLGTVVAFNLIGSASPASTNVTLLLTLGSPLAIGMMDKVTPPRATFPTPPITRWVNARRKDDIVALDMDVNKRSLGFDGVENIYTTMRPDMDPHSIEGYLRDRKIADLLHKVL
jgi:hypothetical protein